MPAELLFWRLLPQADDQGRLPGDPRQLKAIACPMREEFSPTIIEQLLKELEKAKLIIHYSNSSTKYLQIAKWWDYQSAMRRIFPSQYPPPEGWQDMVKGVSGGQTPTIADNVRPEEEVEEEPETGTRIMEPEEEEGKTATAATETATKSRPSETHECPKRVTETAEEAKLLDFLETLEGWRKGRADDLVWLRDFCQDWPDFNLRLAKGCRDYHSGKPRVKHKGVWKNRFRNWMVTETSPQKGKKGGANGADKKRPRQLKARDKYTTPEEWRQQR
jgi:hypothetical protein